MYRREIVGISGKFLRRSKILAGGRAASRESIDMAQFREDRSGDLAVASRTSDLGRLPEQSRMAGLPSSLIRPSAKRKLPITPHRLTADELKGIAAKSCQVVAGLVVPYQWITSYVAGDRIYCVHEAGSAEDIYRHAREGGFPANKVTEVTAVIGPQTALA
jgi:hypothetical protein